MRKESERIRTQLLNILADGQFHSGETLGHQLGLSRTAVSNHIKGLAQLGLEVFSITGKGYRLVKPLTLLNEQQLLKHINIGRPFNIEVLNIIDSTNQYLKDKHQQVGNGHVVLAEAQTAGRGRRGRQWVSPYGASLYLSMYWNFPAGYQGISGLSLVIGLAVARALQIAGVEGTQLKWPNDIYLDNKKLAGVLVEVEGQMGSACDCIIGIGLNVDLPERVEGIGQPFTDLMQHTQQTLDRNVLAAQLITQLIEVCSEFEISGLAPFIKNWQALDLYYDKPIKLITGNQVIDGVGKGIDHSGGLIVNVAGVSQTFYGGEISVKAN